ncbi:MAG TPA: lipid-binding SYLF domain-containing protein [Terriglobales bacterium]|nr:lipid-binding SYLF domain-containing protein [Terriglobales bacterium]
MRKTTIFTLVLALCSFPLFAEDDKEVERLKEAGIVLQEILNIPDNVPQDLLEKSECVVILPSVKKFAIGIGGSAGKGVMTCRSASGWSAPAMFRLEGLNVGLQLGGQATDFILLVMNAKGGDALLGSKVKLGADAAAAAGPKGRNAAAATDAQLKAEILSYSRSKGLFGGVSLEGSTLRQDNGANKKVYGREVTAKEIVREGKVTPPAAAQGLLALLDQKATPKKAAPAAPAAKKAAPAAAKPATKKK